MLESIGRVVVGQNDVVEMMLTALFSNGHCLFVGVPGLAKTSVQTANHARLLLWSRSVYARPDAIDITGTDVLEQDNQTGKRETVL